MRGSRTKWLHITDIFALKNRIDLRIGVGLAEQSQVITWNLLNKPSLHPSLAVFSQFTISFHQHFSNLHHYFSVVIPSAALAPQWSSLSHFLASLLSLLYQILYKAARHFDPCAAELKAWITVKGDQSTLFTKSQNERGAERDCDKNYKLYLTNLPDCD